jgi:hypothetical protein
MTLPFRGGEGNRADGGVVDLGIHDDLRLFDRSRGHGLQGRIGDRDHGVAPVEVEQLLVVDQLAAGPRHQRGGAIGQRQAERVGQPALDRVADHVAGDERVAPDTDLHRSGPRWVSRAACAVPVSTQSISALVTETMRSPAVARR